LNLKWTQTKQQYARRQQRNAKNSEKTGMTVEITGIGTLLNEINQVHQQDVGRTFGMQSLR
jgi:hypothetical protein